MRGLVLASLALAVPSGLAIVDPGHASDSSSTHKRKAAPIDCKAPDAPYQHYECLDAYLGDGFWERLINYYRLEYGHGAAPADPDAPPDRRKPYPPAPESVPPYPFTEWPYGGSEYMMANRTTSVDSPLMVALAPTPLGKAMSAASIQMYGWVDPGGNFSTNKNRPAGNNPANYSVNPNTFQLDQAVIYIERTPDTVQTDHVDWGFRVSGIYGENYRYTNGYGYMSYQFNGHNLFNGYDFPMMYGELYIPQVAEGLLFRLGRFISLPDIEAQLAPNNNYYSHSLTYGWDNYTNTGLQSTVALTHNWFLQFGVTVGTEAAPWHWGQTVPNPFPNPVFPGNTMPKDPGATPSFTTGFRSDSIYVVADSINSGTWGYNNLQWYGITFYHKFNDKWHFSWENYTLSQHNVLNAFGSNAAVNAIIGNGGFPFTPANSITFNGPNFAVCPDPSSLTCTARVFTSLIYVNYQIGPLDSLGFRTEFYHDMEAQRTASLAGTRFMEWTLAWQHWLSPQIEFRPEIAYYKAFDQPAFNANPYTGILPNKKDATILSSDVIVHF